MRSFTLGIVILMTVPAYAAAQERDNSERTATGRTAIPRNEAVRTAPPRQAERRAEPRGGARPSPRPEETPQAAPSRAGREGRTTTNAPATPTPSQSRPPLPHQERPAKRVGDYQPRHRRPHGRPNVVFVPYATPVIVEREVVVEREPSAPVIVEQASRARLILDIHPPTAQVFSDGYYIGVPDDFRFEMGGAVLEPGPHRIDILARDYEPVSFDVNLTRGQSATFRHTLTPIVPVALPAREAAQKAPPVAKKPETFYLIPGCYMGNVPPKEANLPKTCDPERAVLFRY